MKLAIVSHTRHYLDKDGNLHGWGPTIREINFLASHFTEIVHAACLHPGLPPPSALQYTSQNIRFVPLPTSGGRGLKSKISSFSKANEVIRQVKPILSQVDAMQLRVPTGMANYLLPWLTLKKNRPLTWVKYAGNWNQEDAPAGYRFQRWWLQRNFLHAKVTINGHWPNQPSHCISFGNPCLDHQERMTGKRSVETRQYKGPYIATFIGRIEEPKGVGRILEALPVFESKGIQTIHFIGEGPDRARFEAIARNFAGVKCIFHGSVPQTRIAEFLSSSHFLLLPSTASEGFPKVIAEGANYGAIPIVSDISSIGQIVNDANGYVWPRATPFGDWLQRIEWSPESLAAKAKSAWHLAEAFTFEQYYQKLRTEILHDLEPFQ